MRSTINKSIEGYVLVAANSEHYLELAASAASSLRTNDDRQIALLISGGIRVPKPLHSLFDYIIAFDPPAPYDGDFLRRFVLDSYTPFERAFHIDADCLLIKDNIDKFWQLFAGQPFGVCGQLQISGKCYRDQIDVDAILRHRIANGVYITNWGVFYYDSKCENIVMREARDLIMQHLDTKAPTPLSYLSRPGQWSDEPFWGISVARSGIPVPSIDYGDALQITSPNTSNHQFKYAEKLFSVTKGGIPGTTGQFYHFAALNPLDAYLEGVAYYRRLMHVPLPAIQLSDNSIIRGERWAGQTDKLLSRMADDKNIPSFRFLSHYD